MGNAEEWRTYMDTFLSENKELGKAIPKLIHQIWVGPKRMLTYAARTGGSKAASDSVDRHLAQEVSLAGTGLVSSIEV